VLAVPDRHVRSAITGRNVGDGVADVRVVPVGERKVMYASQGRHEYGSCSIVEVALEPRELRERSSMGAPVVLALDTPHDDAAMGVGVSARRLGERRLEVGVNEPVGQHPTAVLTANLLKVEVRRLGLVGLDRFYETLESTLAKLLEKFEGAIWHRSDVTRTFRFRTDPSGNSEQSTSVYYFNG
jgi:hypothetical protein